MVTDPNKYLAVMGNIVRRNIVAALVSGPLSAADLAEGFEMSIAGMMKHLKILEGVDLIYRKKVGRRNLCYINYDSFRAIGDWPDLVELYWLDAVTLVDSKCEVCGQSRYTGCQD